MNFQIRKPWIPAMERSFESSDIDKPLSLEVMGFSELTSPFLFLIAQSIDRW